MSTKKKISFYANTGFNTVDVPESIELVEENANRVITLNNYNIIQTNNLAEILVSGLSEEDCNQIDYVVIEDDDNKTGYILQDRGFEFRADNTIKFFLIRDSWATMGGFTPLSGNNLVYGTAERMHVMDDDETYYTELEPFKPAERPHLIEGIEGLPMDPSMTDDCNIILETVVAPPEMISSPSGEIDTTVSGGTGNYKIPGGPEVEIEYTKGGNIKRVIRKTTGNAAEGQKGVETGGSVSVNVDPETGDPVGVSLASLISPNFRVITPTNYTLGKPFDGTTSIKTGTMWWNGENMNSTWTDGYGKTHKVGVLRNLRVSGAENGAVAYWAINKNYIKSMSDSGFAPTGDSAGGITSIESKTLNNTAIFTTTFMDYKNNKVYYGQALTMTVFNPISGNSLTKQAYEIRNPECLPNDKVSRADYSITADIRSGGHPLFTWKYVNGEDQQDSFMETIKGGNWRQIPLAATGAPNGLERQMDLNRQKDELGAKTFLGIGAGIVQLGIAAATMNPLLAVSGVGTIIGSTVNYSMSSRKQQEQQTLLNNQGEMASVALNLSTSEFLREMGKNSFYNVFTIYSEEDIKAFDRFLTLYGYKVNNKILTEDDFYSRPSFNFIKANDIDIQSDKHSMRLINEVRDQLKAGIRIWHELPNSEAIVSGNKEE